MKSSTSFRPGQTGNPAGRSKAYRELARYIRDKTLDGKKLVDVALEIALDAMIEPRVRLLAVGFLADRGIGKPVQAVELNLTADGDRMDDSDVASLSDEELLELADATDHT